ncbi:MAG TPA: DUF1844 domain-containing protein [Acidobacteriota bacterium]|nr:DUF1844 domain-containing protein [Acidobacteriota bacterium]
MGSDKKDDLRVEDRRHFDREGNLICEGESAGAAAASAQPAEPDFQQPAAEAMDFISVLFSYVHTALIYLGDLEDPLQKKTSENLEGARQMIDILEMMQQKTRGNLSANETQYLESALYDLRMRYVKKNKLVK